MALSFKPQGKGDESIAHSAEVRYVPADSAGGWSYKVVGQPLQPIYEGGQKISFLGQIGDGILFCSKQINEVRPFKEDAFRMKDMPFEFRLSIASADFRDQDNRIYGFDIAGKKKLSDLGATI